MPTLAAGRDPGASPTPSAAMVGRMDAESAFAASPIAQAMLGQDARIRRVNHAWVARAGGDPSGRAWPELLHPDDRDAAWAVVARLREGGGSHRISSRIGVDGGGWIDATVEATAAGDGILVTLLPAAPPGPGMVYEHRILAAAMSHDLRQHARLTSSYLSLLARAPLGEVERERLAMASDHAARLLAAFAGLVRWLRLSDQPLDRGPCDIAVIAARIAEGVPGLVLEAGPLPMLCADAILVEEMLRAVLENAARYAPPPAVMAAQRDGDCWEISISDNGPGIPESERARIIDPLRRLHAWEQVPGHGLGLAIASRIAARHGGSLTVGASPAGGCRIAIRLPA